MMSDTPITELRDAVRTVLAREAPATLADAAAGDRRERAWALAADLGWPAIAIPEESGGLGLGLGAQAVVLEEAGRALLAAPLLTTALASALLQASIAPSLDAAPGLLAEIAEGAAATLVCPDARATRPVWSHGRVDGIAAHVPDADLAHAYVVVADDAAGGAPVTLVVAAEDATWTAEATPIDPGRPLATVTFAAAPAAAIGQPGCGLAIVRALAASELVGVAARALDVALAHAREREQFGRPIGGFQAVKHLLADAYVAIERARSLVRGAVAGASAPSTVDGAMAKAAASEAALGAVKTAIQVTGALGITAEHELPWLLRRARVAGQLGGDARTLYAEIGRRLAEDAR